MPDFARRRDKLRRLLRRQPASSLLVTDDKNVTYLTGFSGDSSYLLVTPDNEILISDFRYEQQIQEECAGIEVSIRTVKVTILDAVEKVVKQAKLTRMGIEAESMAVATWSQLAERCPQLELSPTRNLVEELREIKDKEEIIQIKSAIRIAERAFEVVRASLRLEQSEKDIADALEYQIRLFGGMCTSFPPIVAVGERGALPHATPSPEIRIGDAEFVLIDWGAVGGLYCSDLTRVCITGKLSPKLEAIYGVVLNAQRKGIESIRPGALMNDVDAAARDVIVQAGFGKRFGHGLGHGIGLRIHESPRLAATESRPLKAGMVVTVEPGIYLPGWGGVRIEDDVLVTRNGHEVLTHVPKQLADQTLNLN